MATRAILTPADALVQLRAIVARIDNATLGLLAEAAIAELDDRDGDPDLEPEAADDDSDSEQLFDDGGTAKAPRGGSQL